MNGKLCGLCYSLGEKFVAVAEAMDAAVLVCCYCLSEYRVLLAYGWSDQRQQFLVRINVHTANISVRHLVVRPQIAEKCSV